MSTSAGAAQAAAKTQLADPSPEQLAAIVAAIEMSWPRPVIVTGGPVEESTTWRFSGRWWSKPHAVRRIRPWVQQRG